MDKIPNGRPKSDATKPPLAKPKREPPTQRSIEASLMRTAVIAGLVFIALGAAVALWIFVSYRA